MGPGPWARLCVEVSGEAGQGHSYLLMSSGPGCSMLFPLHFLNYLHGTKGQGAAAWQGKWECAFRSVSLLKISLSLAALERGVNQGIEIIEPSQCSRSSLLCIAVYGPQVALKIVTCKFCN